MFYVHAMFIGNRQKEAIYLFFSGLSLWRRSNSENLTGFKIQAETLMTFAGDFFFTEVATMLFKLKSVLYPPDATAINRRR